MYDINCPACGHEVICTGKEISRKIRPASAGLNGLQPKPPNDILPTPMANRAPIMIIHIGRFDGRLNASNTPVMMAEPSVMVRRSRFKIYLLMAHSKNTQAATDTAVTTNAPMPKAMSDTRNAGISAMSTPYIFFCTLSLA